MFQNYLKIAWRNLLKNKVFSAINIAGLAVGIGCCLLIMLYVSHELSYDRWNSNAERILRPTGDINFGGSHIQLAVVGSVMGPDIAKEIPELQTYCRFRQYGSYLVKRDGIGQPNLREENVLTVDSTFFEVFPLKILEGDARNCLVQPKSAAISRSRADKYFGSPQLAIGQILLLENKERWKVNAVFEDIPTNSHFSANLLLAMNGNEEVKNDPVFWGSNNNFQTYLLLRKGVDADVFAKKFNTLSKEKLAITAQQMLGTTIEEIEKSGQWARYSLQSLTDIHLHSDLIAELAPNGSIRTVWIFSAIAFFILAIACINFMNLSTARSANRAREVGMRKVLGSHRSGLIGQFLSESTIIAAIAVVLALLLALLVLPWFSDLADRKLAMPWGQPLFWLSLVGTVGVVGLLAGSYPAFFLSAFDAIKVLKNQVVGLRRGGVFRNTLVVFQFTASVALIISTLLVFKQLNFIQNKKLGFDKSQVLILDDAYALGDRIYAFKEEMVQNPAIENATVSGYLPVPSSRSDQGFSKTRTLGKDMVSMQRWQVDSKYLKTLGMELAAGRDFDSSRPTDSSAIIINETAARLWGFDDPLGKIVYTLDNFGGSSKPEDFIELTIIGVVKDFHWASLRDNIGALSLQLGSSTANVAFRYNGTETDAVISALEKKWKEMAPDQPFSYRFMDESFARMYAAEQRVGKIAGIFALLSVIVSCLGLFGLASFMVEQRTKEIGVRKVLGASVENLVGFLSKDFLKLVLLGIVIAAPLGWWGMKRWLADFAYRIDIGWEVFALAGLTALVVAFLTISFQSIRAASANPVKSLRSE